MLIFHGVNAIAYSGYPGLPDRELMPGSKKAGRILATKAGVEGARASKIHTRSSRLFQKERYHSGNGRHGVGFSTRKLLYDPDARGPVLWICANPAVYVLRFQGKAGIRSIDIQIEGRMKYFIRSRAEGVAGGVCLVFVRSRGCNLRCAWCDTPTTSLEPERATSGR